MTDQLEEARFLAALAGIGVPPEREAALAGGLAVTKRIAESLAAQTSDGRARRPVPRADEAPTDERRRPRGAFARRSGPPCPRS